MPVNPGNVSILLVCALRLKIFQNVTDDWKFVIVKCIHPSKCFSVFIALLIPITSACFQKYRLEKLETFHIAVSQP